MIIANRYRALIKIDKNNGDDKGVKLQKRLFFLRYMPLGKWTVITTDIDSAGELVRICRRKGISNLRFKWKDI